MGGKYKGRVRLEGREKRGKYERIKREYRKEI